MIYKFLSELISGLFSALNFVIGIVVNILGIIGFFYFDIFPIIEAQRRKKRLHEYFENAIRTWLLRDDEAARAAAITTVEIAPGPLHGSLLDYVAALSNEIQNDASPGASLLCQRLGNLAAQLPPPRFWTNKERRRKLSELGTIDREYAVALARAKPDVFAKRYPDLFS